MARWIALFRGINVGGRNTLPMQELVAIFEAHGCHRVRTYIQSGNVVFDGPAKGAKKIAVTLGDEIAERRGFRPGILVLSAEELRQAAAANPFPEAQAEPKALHLFFLGSKPRSPDTGAMEDAKTASESFSIVDRVMYLHAPDGIARSKLATRAERLIGVPATARNWRTVTKLLEIGEAAPG